MVHVYRPPFRRPPQRLVQRQWIPSLGFVTSSVAGGWESQQELRPTDVKAWESCLSLRPTDVHEVEFLKQIRKAR